MAGSYNLRSPAVKRLMKEAQELREPTEQFFAQPLDDNLFEWHFTIRGPADSEFETGVYHGRIILPPEYPMKPPSIILLTQNGRFEINKKICLSISGHHPESWQPSWSLRTALLAIIGFMPTHGNGAIGSLDYSADERKFLAKKSLEWKCPQCGPVQKLILPVTEASKALNKEAKELGSQINLQGEKEKSPAAAASSAPETAATETSTVAGDQASGAAGPVPASETMPSLPTFPYPFDPRLMFGAARFPFPAGTNPPNPMMPMFMPPPFFLRNMMTNPWYMQPRPLGTFPYPGFPPAFPVPGLWMGAGQNLPPGLTPGTNVLAQNPLNQPGVNPTGFGTGAAQSGVTPSPVTTSSVNEVPNPVTQSDITAQQAHDCIEPSTPSSSSSTSVDQTSGAAHPNPLMKDSSSESVIPSSSSQGITTSSPLTEPHPTEPDDPVPLASELRQRNRAHEQRSPPFVQRTNQSAEIPQHQNSLSSNISRMLLNFLVAILILCIVALLSRRFYLLG